MTGALTSQKLSKKRLQKDIEFQIAKLITEPRLYDNFIEEQKLLKTQKAVRTALELSSISKGAQVIDHLNKNVAIAKNLRDY